MLVSGESARLKHLPSRLIICIVDCGRVTLQSPDGGNRQDGALMGKRARWDPDGEEKESPDGSNQKKGVLMLVL